MKMRRKMLLLICSVFILASVGCKKSAVRKNIKKPEKPYQSFLIYEEPTLEKNKTI